MQKTSNRTVIRLDEDFALKCKALRAAAIKKYMEQNGFKQCVCFSCGNSSRALLEAGVKCVDISPKGDLIPSSKWWSKSEIKNAFASCFDATSGHLPIELLTSIAQIFSQNFTKKFEQNFIYEIPTGSGETIFCLKIAFPLVDFVAVYSEKDKSCTYNPKAPLTPIIKAFFKNKIEK